MKIITPRRIASIGLVVALGGLTAACTPRVPLPVKPPAAHTSVPKPPAPKPPAETVSQRNARQKAAEYLQFMSFSRTGLIEQLEYEGFSPRDATYGVDALHVNWNQQAAKKAAEYLKIMPFSRSGLIDQLVFDGFTQQQAAYGVSTTGL
jgi:hypothetical protein